MHIPLLRAHDTWYAVFHLERVLMLNALGEYARLYEHAPDFHTRSVLVQQHEFIQTLLRRSAATTTYELRYTAHGSASVGGSYPHISVHCGIALRTDHDQARAEATALAQLLHAQFPDLVWAATEDIATFLALPDMRHAVSLSRSAGSITAHGHSQRSPLRFSAQHPAQTDQPVGARGPMYLVQPFIHTDTTHHTLFGVLLQHPAPVTISIRMAKSAVTAAETRFLQENLAAYDDPHEFPASVAEQLTHAQRIMHSMLLRWYDCAALVSIDILSPAPIPDHVITLLGNLLTQPQGGWFKSSDSAGHPIHYQGGIQATVHADPAAVIDAARRVTIRPIPRTDQPLVDRLPHLLDASEAAMVFRVPRSSLVPLPGMTMQSHRSLPPPRTLAHTGTRIGSALHAGTTQPIHISDVDRTRHAYIIGQTGTGKSTVLKQMILDDITRGRGVCVIDPHGDLVDDVLAHIPAARHDDVILIDPTQTEFPIGLNLFAYTTQEEREIAIQLFQKTVELIEYARGTPAEYMGPVFWQHLRNNAYWVTQDPADPGTVIELYNMYALGKYHKRWQPIDTSDSKLVSWQGVLDGNDYHRTGNDSISPFSYFSSKFEDFVFDTRLRLLFGQKQSLDMFDAMNTRKIILINLSRGVLSEIASAFVGGVLLAKLQQAALKRASLPQTERDFFGIYVDEFQNYTSDSFISLLSESRKYGISLTLANQFLAQITNRTIISAVLGNVGTIVSFRVGIEDAEFLKGRFAPEITPNDLINLPNWHAYVATQVDGQSIRPFSMQTIRPADAPDPTVRSAIMARSTARYGTPRAQVEATIAASMELTRKSPTDATLNTRHDAAAISINTTPCVAELVTHPGNDTISAVVHSAGLVLWQAQIAATKRAVVRTIGVAPAAQAVYRARELSTLLPFCAGWGSGHRDTAQWLDTHGIATVGALIDALTYQQQTGEVEPTVVAHAHALLAYAAHDHPEMVPYRDIALSEHLAVTLDHDGTATIWNARYRATHHVIPGALAIAATTARVYVLHGDGTVWWYDVQQTGQVENIPALTRLTGGEFFVIGQDAAGDVHIITTRESVAEGFTGAQPTQLSLVAAGEFHAIGVDRSGAVISWGHRRDAGEVPAALRSGSVVVTALAAGARRAYAVDSAGRLYAWGRHGITEEALQTLNAIGVRAIYAIDTKCICQTSDGRWWLNGAPFPNAHTIDMSAVERIICNQSGVFLATTHTPFAHRVSTLHQTQIALVPNVPTDAAVALSRVGVTNVLKYLQLTPADVAGIPFFIEHPDAHARLSSAIDTLLAAQGLTLPTGCASYQLEALIQLDGDSGYYLRTLRFQPATESAKRSGSNDDYDFDFDAFFDDL